MDYHNKLDIFSFSQLKLSNNQFFIYCIGNACTLPSMFHLFSDSGVGGVDQSFLIWIM